MTKLLHRSFKSFLAYTVIVLTCSIPAYFVIVDWIWQHELKEHNTIVASGIKHHLRSWKPDDTAWDESIRLWNRLQPERQIRAAGALAKDSTYNVYRTNPYIASKKEDRFQGLVSYFEMNGKPYSITVETNMEESYETILGLTAVAVLFFILLLGGLIIINRRLSVRMWKPFYKSLNTIQGFDLNKQEPVTFDETDILEFDTLNAGLTRLIDRNIATFRQQKHFIENAAHELQTPLAVIQAKLDVFLQDASLTGRQSHNIEQAQHAMSRINRINKNLLLLAKIENSQFPETTPVNLSDILGDNLSLISSFIEEKQLQVRTDSAPAIIMETNTTLAEILISNLLLNAIRYSPEKGIMEISLSSDSLRISNTGTAPLNKDHLFKRFGRASSEAPATGLGLSIVHQVCQQYGWNITYDFRSAQHHFLVVFS